MRLFAQAALLVFFAAAAGTGVVAADSLASASDGGGNGCFRIGVAETAGNEFFQPDDFAEDALPLARAGHGEARDMIH